MEKMEKNKILLMVDKSKRIAPFIYKKIIYFFIYKENYLNKNIFCLKLFINSS